MRARRIGVLLAAGMVLAGVGCGAKSGLIDDPVPDAGLDAAPDVECIDDIDCDDGIFCNGAERCRNQECRPARRRDLPTCDDGDACTDDTCDVELDECTHVSNMVDADADGFTAEDCGPDCDDTDPLIYPGAPEVCNGKDDDCDDLIDEDLLFEPSGDEVRITNDEAWSAPGGLAWNDEDEQYGISWWDYRNGDADVYFLRLDENGQRVEPDEFNVTLTSGDAYGASVTFTGPPWNEYGLAWEDRRDSDFEIYFQRMNTDGQKLMADRRISYGADFSINSSIAWNPDDEQWGIAWEDRRHAGESGDDIENFELYFSRVGLDGIRIPPAGSDQPEVRLTFTNDLSESPQIVWAGDEWGVVWNEGQVGDFEIYFRRFDLEGNALVPAMRVTDAEGDSINPTIGWSGTEYAIAWMDERPGQVGDQEIFWAHFGKDESPLERPVTNEAANSRYPSLLWTGSKWLLGWSDYRDGNYEIYYAVFDQEGARIGGDRRLTNRAEDSVFASFTRGGGDIGVLWNDFRDLNWEVYFTELLCSGDAVVE